MSCRFQLKVRSVGERKKIRSRMFTFRLIKSSVNSVRLSPKCTPARSDRLLSFFKRESKEEEEQSTLQIIDAEEEDPILRQQRIEKMCNKSGLRPQHRNILRGELPYNAAESWIHNTLKYKRKLYGKLGSQSNVDPSELVKVY